MKYLFLLILSLAVSTVVSAGENYFIENKGQLIDQYGNDRSDIKFYASAEGRSIFISETGFSIQSSRLLEDDQMQFNRIDFKLKEFSADIISGNSQMNYEETQITEQGNFRLKSYEKVICKDQESGIEIHFYTTPKGFKYDVVIPESSSVSAVDVIVEGGTIKKNRDHIEIRNGELKLKETIPEIYHLNEGKKSFVQGSYELTADGYRIVFENTNDGQLIVDPFLTYASYYGGNSVDDIRCVGTDENGNYIVGGTTSSNSNIATSGAYTSTYSIYGNMFIAKFDENNQRIWATYYHSSYINPRQLEFDPDGNFYIAGMTGSGDNLGTAGTHQTFFGGNYNDCFILKMSSDGFPIWSTLYGGNGNDILYDMKLDTDSEHIYIVGETGSDSLISTPGAFIENSPAYGGNADGFMAKFDTTGNLEIGTYVGGLNSDKLESVVVKDDGVYVAGDFGSYGLGTTGAYYENNYSNSDLYLSKFNHSLDQIWGTYFTGDLHVERRHDLAVVGGKIYVAFTVNAWSTSTAYTTPGAFKEVSQSGYEACILQFDTSGTQWNWGTFYGGSLDDNIFSISAINDSTIAIAGTTTSNDSIATDNVYKPYLTNGVSPYYPYGPSKDMFVAVIDSSSNIKWGSYYGGAHNEQINDMALTSNNELITVGSTFSLSGISTTSAHQYYSYSGNSSSGYIAKFDADRDSIFTDLTEQLPAQACPKEYLNVPFTAEGTYFDDNVFQLWMSDEYGDFTNAILMDQMTTTTSDTFTIQIPYLISGGMYQFRVDATSPVVEGVSTDPIEILTSPQAQFSYQIGSNDVYFTDQSINAQSWIWDFDTGDQSTLQDPIYDFPDAGSYMVQLVSDNGICSDTAVHEVMINNVAGMEEMNNEIIIAPNPTTDHWAIQIPHPNFEIEVYSMQGKLCYQSKTVSTYFDLRDLESGTYIIRFTDQKNGSINYKEIVKL